MNKRSDANLRKSIGNNIKKFREKMYPGYGGQGKFAEAIKIAQPTIASYEAGKQQPSDSRLKKIAKHFGVDVSELRGEKKDFILSEDQTFVIEYANQLVDEAGHYLSEAVGLISAARADPGFAHRYRLSLDGTKCPECQKPRAPKSHDNNSYT